MDDSSEKCSYAKSNGLHPPSITGLCDDDNDDAINEQRQRAFFGYLSKYWDATNHGNKVVTFSLRNDGDVDDMDEQHDDDDDDIDSKPHDGNEEDHAQTTNGTNESKLEETKSQPQCSNNITNKSKYQIEENFIDEGLYGYLQQYPDIADHMGWKRYESE